MKTTRIRQPDAEGQEPDQGLLLLVNVVSRRMIASTICTLVLLDLQALSLTYVHLMIDRLVTPLTFVQFANLQMGTQSLTHTVPKGRDMYAAGYPTYPFPVIPNHSSSLALLKVLPEMDEILACLDMFQRRAQSCSFPHTPEEVTKKEVERFLDDAEHNAEKAPDMLALIFVTLATGLQMGQYDRNGGKWDQAASTATRARSDVFCKCAPGHSITHLMFSRKWPLVCSLCGTHRS